ncbi:hypothetical protein WOLCODRAFT_21002 [Wolfiporia cocos MD-104 SS10]|uniref:Uncharacterized protein n=1 Tax=Wolfiporia cocos (strain MD-104) TaxID=742152 RepID=A0A2H3J6G1_WOLCO|nr:hypothetical protein WOLCODRAFT_21002 [Wolfiporia cocos MD-104 SS10]
MTSMPKMNATTNKKLALAAKASAATAKNTDTKKTSETTKATESKKKHKNQDEDKNQSPPSKHHKDENAQSRENQLMHLAYACPANHITRADLSKHVVELDNGRHLSGSTATADAYMHPEDGTISNSEMYPPPMNVVGTSASISSHAAAPAAGVLSLQNAASLVSNCGTMTRDHSEVLTDDHDSFANPWA